MVPKRKSPRRYVVHDLAARESGELRNRREPWAVVDTTTNTIVDTYSSKRAATMHARALNDGTVNP